MDPGPPNSDLQGAGREAVLAVELFQGLVEQPTRKRELVVGPAFDAGMDRESLAIEQAREKIRDPLQLEGVRRCSDAQRIDHRSGHARSSRAAERARMRASPRRP